MAKKKKKSKWLDLSAFKDGYDAGDVTRTVVRSGKKSANTVKKAVGKKTSDLTEDTFEFLSSRLENNKTVSAARNILNGGSNTGLLEELFDSKLGNALKSPFSVNEDEKDEKEKKEEERSYFKKGAFKDGYDFGDIGKTIYGTTTDIGENIGAGLGRIGEGLIDTVAYGAGSTAKALGKDKFAEKTKDFISRNLVDEYNIGEKYGSLIFGAGLPGLGNKILNKGNTERSSILGEKSDSIVQSGGQLLGTAGLQMAGVPWFVTTGVTGFGTGVEDAFKSDATYGEAGIYGGISAGSEIIFEKLGGIKFGGKALDTGVKRELSKAIANKSLKALSKFGLDVTAEGTEEVLTEITQNIGKKLTYEDEKTWAELLTSEEAMDNYLEAFIGGAVIGGGFNAGKTVKSIKTGRDYDTGLTDHEQSIVNAEVESRAAEKMKQAAVDTEVEKIIAEKMKTFVNLSPAEKKNIRESVQSKLDSGELDYTTATLSKKERSEIEKQVEEDLKKGYIGIDTIESTLSAEKTSRIKELEQQLTQINDRKQKTQIEAEINQLKGAKAEELKGLLSKDVYLQESYRQEALKGQEFTRKVTDEDSDITKELIESAKSSKMNNTRKMHDLFEYTNKIANDAKTKYGFVNNEQLKQLGYDAEGKTINGLVRVSEDGTSKVLINVDSDKSLNTIIGHETTHLLEGTGEYTALQNLVKEYATTKGEYNERLKQISSLYQGVNADIENEITADLVGDYLFTDEQFINNLSTKEPNVFQKIYDYIKHVYKMATAGSAEARQLEQVKRKFDKAYKQISKTAVQVQGDNSLTDALSNTVKSDNSSEVQNVEEIQEPVKREPTKEQQEYFKDSKVRDEDGNLKVMYHGTSSGGHTVFDPFGKARYGLFGAGSYFTDNKSVAESYTEKGRGNNKQIYETYLNITNPIDMDAQANREAWAKALPDADFPETGTNEDFYRAMEEYFEDQEYAKWEASEAAMDIMEGMGYDGITHIGGGRFNKKDETRHRVYIAFHPEQIKNIDNTKPTTDPDIRYSLSDSDGRKLTEKQQEYFKDSKVRDDNGNLLVMYHGTPNAEFTVFRDGTYFTQNKWYADNYQAQGASSLGYKKTANKPDTYEVYLNIKKPFDTRNPEERRIFEEEYYGQWGMGTPLMNSGLPDWMDGEDLKEFIEENGYDYDGLILDEGGVGGYGDEVINRGLSYVVFSPEQVKNASNADPTSDPDIRYSLSDSNLKEKQLDIVLNSNPVNDDYHTWIRNVDDIHTFEEALNSEDYADYKGEDFDPSYPYSIAERALSTGKITVYSSYPIEQGAFVTPSIMEAESYSGNGQIYSKEVNLTDIAWIDPTQGQYAKVDDSYSISDPNKDIAPTGNYNVYGSDVKLQVEEAIAPVQEEIADLKSALTDLRENVAALAPEPRALTAEDLPYVEQQRDDAFDNISDDIAPVEEELLTQPYEEEPTIEVESPFEDKDMKEVGKRNVKAYMYENPEVKPYFQSEAAVMLTDLKNSIKGERGFNDELYYITGGEEGFWGTTRQTTEDIAYLLDEYKYSYADIEKGLKAIIEDHGAENNAISKRIEFFLDERLREGYNSYDGLEIPPNEEYINILREKQITEYDDAHYEEWLRSLANAEPPVFEDDIAPVETASQTTIEAPAETAVEEDIAPVAEEVATTAEEAQQSEQEDLVTKTRKELRKDLLADKSDFLKTALDNAKNKPMALLNNTDTVRVSELVFGRQAGKKINDTIFQPAIDNEAKSIRWQNKQRADIKTLGIKPRSKESAAVQKYGEKQYVNEFGDLVPYGEAELKAEFPKESDRIKIKKAARIIRDKYDVYIDDANGVLTQLGFSPIPKRDDYMRHFQELNDIFSKFGIPFNAQSMEEHTLPTDINGLTEFWSPQKNYFANMQPRKGIKTEYDAITGVDGYISGIANLIFHTKDIQRGRAFEEMIRNRFGQETAEETLNSVPEEERAALLELIQNNHLSNYAAWVHEWTNNLAGKKNKVDRSIESMFGRKAFSFLDTVRKQVGANMIGFNVASSLTNLISPIQAMSKTNKIAVLKGTADTFKNIVKKDGFVDKNLFLTSRFGTDMLSKNMWQKTQDAAYIFMKGIDSFASNMIVRSKYHELISKGMSDSEAHAEAGKFAARIMGDRTKGAQAQLYNSKLVGMVTQFQLEVNNQLYSMFYDTLHESKEKAKGNSLKAAAGMTFTLGQLFAFTHLFGKAFENVAGYNPTFDVIGIIQTLLGIGGDDEEKKPLPERAEAALLQLLKSLPYTSTFTGGRIPIGQAFPIEQLVTGKDDYGNDKSRTETIKETLPYYVLPAGYGQIKKTAQGLKMFDKDNPVPGSYTDSGNLRFPVEDTLANRVKSGIFGQWSHEEARDYIDNERAPLKEKQIQEYKELDIPIADYWKYREGLRDQDTLEEKFDYIAGLDLPVSKKNIMINNIVDRKESVDLESYSDFGSYAEFDFATKNPDKYALAMAIGGYKSYEQYTDDLWNIKADKDSSGKSIRGSRQKKVINYINGLDIDYEAKLILYKREYNSDDAHNQDIIDYLNNRDDISYDQMESILIELGFTVTDDGTIYW